MMNRQDLAQAADQFDEINSGMGSSRVVARLVGGALCATRIAVTYMVDLSHGCVLLSCESVFHSNQSHHIISSFFIGPGVDSRLN